MRVSSVRRRRGWVAVLGMVLCAALVSSTGIPAGAAVPAMTPRASNVVTADGLPTVQINGVVTTQVIAGDTVFAGGNFTHARPAGVPPRAPGAPPGPQEVRRFNLLSYNITTGVLNAFAPEINGTVNALALRADKRILYVGGNFTRVGTATRNRFAAFTVSSGNLRATAPSVNGEVKALTVTNTAVYLGGKFTRVDGAYRVRLGAIDLATDKVTRWVPQADNTVLALTATPDKTKVIVGGFFGQINGSSVYGLAATDASTGALKTWLVNRVVRDWGIGAGGTGAAILSLTADADTVYGSGYAFGRGNFEGVFAANQVDGRIRWLQDCHGDTYSVAPVGNVVYSVGHAHFCGNIGGMTEHQPRFYRRALVVTKAVAGTVAPNTQNGQFHGNFDGQPAPSLINWFPDINTGTHTGQTQGAWSVAANATYVVLGGEFTEINGVRQQGLVRMAIPSAVAAKQQGPLDTRPGTAPTISAGATAGTAVVRWPANWDRDDLSLTYQVLRDSVVVGTVNANSTSWNRPLLQATDTGLSPGTDYRYRIRVTDSTGNTLTSATTIFRYPAEEAYADTIVADDASHQWRFEGPAGATTEPDEVGSADLALGSDVTLGGAGASASNTGKAATLAGTDPAGSSSAGVEASSSEVSIEFWMKTAKNGGSLAAFGTDSGPATTTIRTRELYLSGLGQLSFTVRKEAAGTSTPAHAETPASVADNKWHHVVAVQSSRGLFVYVDGLERAATSVTPAVTGTGRWWVGGRAPARLPKVTTSAYAGQIDELSVFPTALTADQVKAHYQLGMQ